MASESAPNEGAPLETPVSSIESVTEKSVEETTKPATDADEKAGDDTKPGESDETKKEKILVGAVAESKDLYAKYDKDGNRSWSEDLPDGLEEAAENEENMKYAIIVRKKKPKEADSTKPLVIDSIIIQSPFLKKVIGEVMHGYPGIVTQVSRLVIYAGFECFVHRWDRFIAAVESPEHDEVTKEHLTLLHAILKKELGDIITLRQDYFKNKAVTFDHIWTLFVPDTIIFASRLGRPIALRFKRGHFGMTQTGRAYQLECQGIDWDGRIMGWVDCAPSIPEYVGARPFSELPCYPIEYHNQPELIKAVLTERGKKFESLAGYNYKAYEGMALYHPANDPCKTSTENVSTRIVIDALNWEKFNSDHTIYPRALNEKQSNDDSASSSRRGSVSSDSERYFSEVGDELDEKSSKRAPLTDEQLILTSPILRGYSLRNRRWMEFFVDDVKEVTFNEHAFDSLVLEKDQKELILAFAQSQVKFKNAFDDIIAGKGKGIIMLLSGGPGIGKTLTAESVAEEMKVPLYVMSAGDLGSEAYELENSLTQILTMVSNWNAVLLLDECDIFLEARSPADMGRNRIVGIFLRMLEYYEGILFLTTNRVKDMDPAFQSRIHMSLEYPELDTTSRNAVWRTFLGRTVTLDKKFHGSDAYDVTEKEIARLSNLNLNGRQIKNVLKMANLLSCQKGEKLNFGHLQKVLRVQGHSL
jgi:hypothetical protein